VASLKTRTILNRFELIAHIDRPPHRTKRLTAMLAACSTTGYR
jgi:hypothetical protein